MMREGLLVPVRNAIAHAKREGSAIRKADVRVKSDGGWRLVDLEVVPVKLAGNGRDCYLVLFHEPQGQPERPPKAPLFSDGEGQEEGKQLKQERLATKEYLQTG